jgi:hypothetical protein
VLQNATILLVRHAEKDNPSQPDKVGDDPFLSDMGWERADRYVGYFRQYQVTNVEGTESVPLALTHLFAAADHLNTSYRPHQTLQPLANATGLTIDVSIADANYPDLIAELAKPHKYDDATILVCWHHGEIIQLADGLLGAGGLPAPVLSPASTWPGQGTWPPDVFGWLMQIRYDNNGAAEADWVRCINERLMPDDTTDPPGQAQPLSAQTA